MQVPTAILPLLAQAAPAAPLPTLPELMRDHQWFLWFSLLSLAISLIAWWLASKIVAQREFGTLVNALKVFVLQVILGVVVGVAVPFVLPLLSADFHIVAYVLAGLLSLVLIFLIPMKIYKINVLQTIILFVVATIISALGQAGALMTLFREPAQKSAITLEQISKLNVEAQAAYFQGLFQQAEQAPKFTKFSAAEKQAADRALSVEDRQAALKTMYAELEALRGSLQEGDAAGQATYKAQLARYEELLSQLKADVAAGRK